MKTTISKNFVNTALRAIVILVLLTSIYSCKDDNIAIVPPSVISEATDANTEITFTSMKIYGRVISDGGSEITARGVCWSTSPNPNIDNEKTIESSDVFSSNIDILIGNTIYYFRVYATNGSGTTYSEQQSFRTLSLDNTSWKFTTVFPNQNDFELYSQVDFYDNTTTKYDELDFPLHCPGCFITFGSWSLNGNELTYIWEGIYSDSSTYVYKGTLVGMNIVGSYTHMSEPQGSWSAVLL